MQMRYFKSVQGKAFLRPGRPGIYIGCKRKPRDKATGVSPGFMWDVDAVTAVPVSECAQNLRDYNDAVRDKVLIEVKEADFKKATKAREEAQAKVAAEAKAERDKAAKARQKAAKVDQEPTNEED